MLLSLQTYVRRGKRSLKNLLLDPRVYLYARAAACVLAGFCLSAASLGQVAMPLAMGLVCACTGWSAVLVALGSGLGYLLFWGSAGYQCLLWLAAALPGALILGGRRIERETPFLLPAVAGLIVSVSGVIFQTWMTEMLPVGLYLTRICLAAGSQWIFSRFLQRRNPIVDWIACALGILALAQLMPVPYLGLGYVAAAAVTVSGAFPAAALAGVALDLADITPVSMTAVLSAAYLVRFLPKYPQWSRAVMPAALCLFMMILRGQPDWYAVPGLLAGGILGIFLPFPEKLPNRRGETGIAQVRLEMAAGVLAQTEQLLLEAPVAPVDEDALITRAAEQACHDCPCRRNCKDSKKLGQLPAALLHKPLLTPEELPIICRKSGRFLAQLHRSQEQLRTIRADRERQREYRAAVIQQFAFITEFLQELSDELARRIPNIEPVYSPLVQIYGNRPEPDNGDRCILFPGTRCRYYVILCDGMGTGPGAVQEGKLTAGMLRRMLTAGYPAEHALRTVNSVCALRNRAGAVTVELLEVQLDTGKARLFKWGAPPSYSVTRLGVEKIGTAGPPPGLSVTDSQEKVYGLSLRRGELLVLVSDGVGEEEALHCCVKLADRTPGELAAGLLACGQLGGEDDATVVTVRLKEA